MTKVVDKVGQEIKPGAIIAYGHALGRCAGLRIGKVLAVGVKDEGFRITVWGVDGEWQHQEAELLSKKSTLQFPDRMVVLDPEKVNPLFMRLLDVVPLDA